MYMPRKRSDQERLALPNFQYELPYIENNLPKEVRTKTPYQTAKEAYSDRMTQEEEARSKRNLMIFFACVLCFVLFLVVTAPPRKYSYVGDLGKYRVDSMERTLETPTGDVYTFQRTQMTSIVQYVVTDWEGDTFAINNRYKERRVSYGETYPLSGERKDVWNVLMSREEAYTRGSASSFDMSNLLRAIAIFMGVLLLFRPYDFADVGMFTFIYWTKYFRSERYLMDSRKVAILWILFCLTPWGYRFLSYLFMQTFGRVFWLTM